MGLALTPTYLILRKLILRHVSSCSMLHATCYMGIVPMINIYLHKIYLKAQPSFFNLSCSSESRELDEDVFSSMYNSFLILLWNDITLLVGVL